MASEQSTYPQVHRLRRCPKCGAITDRVSHCFVKGPPLFPQMDDYTMTEPCYVVALADVLRALDLAYHPQMGANPMHPVDVLTGALGITDEQYRAALSRETSS